MHLVKKNPCIHDSYRMVYFLLVATHNYVEGKDYNIRKALKRDNRLCILKMGIAHAAYEYVILMYDGWVFDC